MKVIYIHPDNPQLRLISETVSALKSGEIVILPSEHGYHFGFGANAKEAFERLKRLGVADSDLIMICQNISQLSEVAVITNDAFHILKNDFSPQNTFILEPTKMINKKIINKKTLAFNTSDTPIMTAILEQLDEPFFIAPLIYQGEIIHEHHEIADRLESQAKLMVDVGIINNSNTTTIDLTA